MNKSIVTISCPSCGVKFQHHLQHKSRTNNQNSWYWACVVGIPAEEIGYLPDEMHDAYKMMFLRRSEPGKPSTIKSTTMLTTNEFSDYVEKCRQWAAANGYYIPSPKEEQTNEYHKI